VSKGVIGRLRRDEDNTARSSDLFVQGEWTWSPALVVSAGARGGRVTLSAADRYLANGDDSGRLQFDYTNPVLGLRWTAAPGLNLHASVARGYESPTLGEVAYRPSGAGGGLNAAVKAQTSRQAELGAKWRGAQAGLDLTLFETRVTDEIGVATNAGGRSSFQNVGRTLRRGVELAARWQPSASWHAAVAATWLDATYRDDFKTCGPPPCSTPAVLVPAGNRVAGTQRASAFAELVWQRRDLGRMGAGTARRCPHHGQRQQQRLGGRSWPGGPALEQGLCAVVGPEAGAAGAAGQRGRPRLRRHRHRQRGQPPLLRDRRPAQRPAGAAAAGVLSVALRRRAILACSVLPLAARPADDFEGDPFRSHPWPQMRREFLGAQARVRFDDRVRVQGPAFAEDPMNVPISVRVDASLGPVEEIVVLVDRNPIRKVLSYFPLQALPSLALRFKLEQASPVRALARTRDGVWHAGGTWVDSAGGGCTVSGATRKDGSWSQTLGEVSGRMFAPRRAWTVARGCA
jgi:predicted secreted protein